MTTRIRVNSKPWLEGYRQSLRGLTPKAQVIGWWLAEQADAEGRVDAVDWERLAADTGLAVITCRRELRDHGELVMRGRVKRELRKLGNVFGSTIYVLNRDAR